MVQFLAQEDPLEEEMATHSSVLAWRIPWQRSLVGPSSWSCKESDTTEVTEHTHKGTLVATNTKLLEHVLKTPIMGSNMSSGPPLWAKSCPPPAQIYMLQS